MFVSHIYQGDPYRPTLSQNVSHYRIIIVLLTNSQRGYFFIKIENKEARKCSITYSMHDLI